MSSTNISKYRDLIGMTKGKLFRVTFVKADGTIRTMICRTGVKRYLKGGGYNMKPEVALIRRRVFDFKKRAYRTIPIDRIVELKFQGQVVSFDNSLRLAA